MQPCRRVRIETLQPHMKRGSAQVCRLFPKLLADNGANWYFQGTMDKRWTDTLLDQLKRVPAGAFQAVDTSSCMVQRSSARASCPA